ncbi:MAG: hypothetical protein AB7O52_04240 [Planctomycetota bacterium]
MMPMPGDRPKPPPEPLLPGDGDSQRRILPSGRSLDLSVHGGEERIEVRSASGELEVSIVLTESGPVLRLRGAKLEIDSTEAIAVRCRSFELETKESVSLRAGGPVAVTSDDEIRLRSAQQTFIDGDYVNLNCLDRTGYHDENSAETEALPEPPDGPASSSS